jgi:hypothetical protein
VRHANCAMLQSRVSLHPSPQQPAFRPASAALHAADPITPSPPPHLIAASPHQPVTPRCSYLSHGDGASYQGPDEGQYGTGPRCMDDPKYPGGFRAQNPNKINGKIMRVNPDDPRDLQVSGSPWYVGGLRGLPCVVGTEAPAGAARGRGGASAT